MIDLRIIYFLIALSLSRAISFDPGYENSNDKNSRFDESKVNEWSYRAKDETTNSPTTSDLIYTKKIPREDKNVKKISSITPFKILKTARKDNASMVRSNIRNGRSTEALKIVDPTLYSTLVDRDGSKMATTTTSATAAAAAAAAAVGAAMNDRNDPFNGSNQKNPYRFGDEMFTSDDTNPEISNKYKNKDENCERIIRDSMVCMLCMDINSKAKYEQCSYVSKPNEKSYAYTKSRSFGKARDDNKNNNNNNNNDDDDVDDVNNGGGRTAEDTKIVPVEEKHYEPSYRGERYEGSLVKASEDDETFGGIEGYQKKKKKKKKELEEKEGEEEEEEDKKLEKDGKGSFSSSSSSSSSSTDCKRIVRDGKTCTICKDPKNGDNYEKCSYEYQPTDKIYKFSRSKSFGYPENMPADINFDKVINKENNPKDSRYVDYSNDYSLPSYDDGNIKRIHIEGNPYGSYVPDHYKSPSEYKSESERKSESIDRSNCDLIKKDSMTCEVCKDRKTGNNFERCSYSYEPKDKVYAYTKGKSYGSPTRSVNDDDDDDNDERKESTNIYGKERKLVTPYDKIYDRVYQGVYDKEDDGGRYDDKGKRLVGNSEKARGTIYDSSKRSSSSSMTDDDDDDDDDDEAATIDVKKTEKSIANENYRYYDDDRKIKREEIERLLKDFQKEDRSNCKKVIKDNMTCYRCKDDGEDIRKEECVFVGDKDVKRNDNKDRLTYREVKRFKFDPDVRSTGSALKKRNSNDKATLDSDIIEPIASPSENNYYARTMTSDDVEKTPKEMVEDKLHEVEPYEYVAETRPIYDKKLGLTLPAFMLTKSEHEREFDDVVASSKI